MKTKLKYFIFIVLFLISFLISIFYVREYKYIVKYKSNNISSVIMNRFDIYTDIYLQYKSIKKDKFYTVNNKKYYINNSGYLHIGFIEKNNKRYYSNMNGNLIKNLVNINNKDYYFNNKFEMHIGWLYIENNTYYFNNKGIMIKNKMIKIKKESYFFDDKGNLSKNCFIPLNNQTYYVDNNGKMKYNQWIEVNDKNYYLNENGCILKNQWINGNYLNDNGELNILKSKYERDGTVIYTNELESELKKIPENILNDFLNKGWKIILTAKDLQQYNDDQDNLDKTVLGVTVYNDKTIYIKDTSNLSLSVLHEFGHYIDYTYQFISNSPEFLECFNTEHNQLSNYYKNNHFSLNPQELFAEVYSQIISQSDICQQIAPKTSNFIKNKIK